MAEQEVENAEPATRKRRKIGVPHIYIILFAFIALAALATYLVPGGVYERIDGPDGRTTIDPDSFTFIDAQPTTPVDFMLAIPRGMVSAAEVVIFTLMIGGLFGVLKATGLVEHAVAALSKRFARRGPVLIAVLMAVFSTVATLIGTQELALVYVPVILPLIIALKYDSIVAAGVALCATTAGFAAGVLNPINTGLGQKLAGVPLWSGLGLRAAIFGITVAVAIFFVIRYANKVKRDQTASYVHGNPAETEKRRVYIETAPGAVKHVMTVRQRIAAFVALAFFALLVFGVLKLGWFMLEMAGLFIVIGAVVGVIAGLRGEELAESFNDGFRAVLVGALIAGIARGVAVVLENGQILDTIVHGLGEAIGGLPPALAAVGMFIGQMLLNFIIPSGSGQALVTMPIMAPLSDLLDVTRQTAVLAYQLGDGYGNILFPTSGYFMATLAIAGVPWQKWVRFFFPLFLTWLGIALVALVFAQIIGWS
ncbi:YfcC family protein [Glutamicibacter sp. PS]|uniref:YfcC family protein n=1 Tax=Glutamicibacter sp. PS TaxID=3075634 RepID=UPI002847CE34|nr:YfcC family protein [Glutamicibacter sp. PS]MDR4533362.1 AbgT family transporter [Glutamicibacter sp. PS]